jgi:hypothetical protein
MEALGVQLPAAIGRVTEHVPQIIDLIQRLFQQGLAYEAEIAPHTRHTHARTHARTRTRTHTRAHTHTHTSARAHTCARAREYLTISANGHAGTREQEHSPSTAQAQPAWLPSVMLTHATVGSFDHVRFAYYTLSRLSRIGRLAAAACISTSRRTALLATAPLPRSRCRPRTKSLTTRPTRRRHACTSAAGATSCCGGRCGRRRPTRPEPCGAHRGAMGGPGGTSSARRCARLTSAQTSTCAPLRCA